MQHEPGAKSTHESKIRSAASQAVLKRHEGLTVEQALREYVEKKRRAKDGLPLKARTRSD